MYINDVNILSNNIRNIRMYIHKTERVNIIGVVINKLVGTRSIQVHSYNFFYKCSKTRDFFPNI